MKNIFYKFLQIGFLSLVLFISGYSQNWTPTFTGSEGTIYTPKSTAVSVYYFNEMDQAHIDYWDSVYKAAYPNATFLSSSSTTYNCHGWAWYTSETGSHVWINDINEVKKFWVDGSILQPTSRQIMKKYHFLMLTIQP